MSSPVLGQGVGLHKSFRTHVALVGPQAGVDQDVPEEVILFLECLATGVAAVRALVGVRLEMSEIWRWKG